MSKKQFTYYIACSFPRRDEAIVLRTELDRRFGSHLTCIAKWMDVGNQGYADGGDTKMKEGDYARMDLEDCLAAKFMIQITDGDNQLSRGGRHSELGIMLANECPVFVLGPWEQVFHSHDYVVVCDGEEKLFSEIQTFIEEMIK